MKIPFKTIITPTAPAQSVQDGIEIDEQLFSSKSVSVFNEVMDYFTLKMIWCKLPKKVSVQLHIPQSLLGGEQAQECINACKVCCEYMSTFIPSISKDDIKLVSTNHNNIKLVITYQPMTS